MELPADHWTEIAGGLIVQRLIAKEPSPIWTAFARRIAEIIREAEHLHRVLEDTAKMEAVISSRKYAEEYRAQRDAETARINAVLPTYRAYVEAKAAAIFHHFDQSLAHARDVAEAALLDELERLSAGSVSDGN